ncbi:MAG: hypothetical protein GXY33_19285 [Phycisphaerae bacterium]|nr:hypothetical protein [Phycisphaerae bacterium]
MKGRVLCAVVLLSVGLMTVGGCGGFVLPGTSFNASELAKQVLADTVWGDPDGRFRLVFDENAKLVEFEVEGLPAEFADINVNGDPFEIILPEDMPAGLGGQTITAWVRPVSTEVTQNDSGGFDVTMNFTGDVSGVAIAALVNSLGVSFNCTVSPDCTELSNLSGAITVYGPLNIVVFEQELELNETIPLTQLQ